MAQTGVLQPTHSAAFSSLASSFSAAASVSCIISKTERRRRRPAMLTTAAGGITHVDRSGLLGSLGLFGPTAELGVGGLCVLERRLEKVGVCRVSKGSQGFASSGVGVRPTFNPLIG
jgi:hypothetical protein